MKKKQKKGIRLFDIIIIIILIIVAIFIIKNIKNKNKENTNTSQSEENVAEEKYVVVLQDGTKLNDSEKLKEDKKMNEIKLTDTQLTYKNGITTLLCNVTNNSDKEFKMQDVEIILRDENGNEIYRITGVIENLQPGETKQFSTHITADFANAYDFTMVKK